MNRQQRRLAKRKKQISSVNIGLQSGSFILTRQNTDELEWQSDEYIVCIRKQDDRLFGSAKGVIWLSIKRIDNTEIFWSEKQRIKNELVGLEAEAVEIFPAESRLTNTANQYHLWCWIDKKVTDFVGWKSDRIILDGSESADEVVDAFKDAGCKMSGDDEIKIRRITEQKQVTQTLK